MSAEFVIVGGGAYGCAVAYHLARSGAAVRLFEGEALGAGASGGAGKRGVRGNRRDYRELPLMREAYELWPQLDAELGAPTGYERTGGMILVEKEVVGVSGGLVAVEAHAQTQSRLGVPTEVWDRDRLADAYPGLSTSVKAGLYASCDGVASQGATTRAYAQAAQSLGAMIEEKVPVAQILTDGAGKARAVRTVRGEEVVAERGVLLANNAGAADLVRSSFGVELPLWRVYPQAVLLRSENPLELPMLTGHESRAVSLKLLDDGVIMLSGGWRGRHNPETGRGEVDPEAVQGNIEALTALFPELGELTVLHADAGRPEAVTADQIPLIGELADGVYLAAGWTAHGWALVPAAARHIAELMLTGELSAELAPVSLARIGI